MPQSMLGVEGEPRPPPSQLTLLLGDDSKRQAGGESHWNQNNVTKSLSGRLVRSYTLACSLTRTVSQPIMREQFS